MSKPLNVLLSLCVILLISHEVLSYTMRKPAAVFAAPEKPITFERAPVIEQEIFEYVFPVSGRSALDVLAAKTKEGWVIKSVSPLGDTDGHLLALVVLERAISPNTPDPRRSL